jgi:hypothetical protein
MMPPFYFRAGSDLDFLVLLLRNCGKTRKSRSDPDQTACATGSVSTSGAITAAAAGVMRQNPAR